MAKMRILLGAATKLKPHAIRDPAGYNSPLSARRHDPARRIQAHDTVHVDMRPQRLAYIIDHKRPLLGVFAQGTAEEADLKAHRQSLFQVPAADFSVILGHFDVAEAGAG